MIKEYFIKKELLNVGKVRCDGNPLIEYKEICDCGVSSEKFSFLSENCRLFGEISYTNKKDAKGLIIFFAGYGAGRKAYSLEISNLAKAGYIVFSFDGTGCMESEGQCVHGLPYINKDKINFFKYLDSLDEYKKYRRLVVGHSWGGYCALSCLNNDFHIEKIVSMSGYLSHMVALTGLAPKLQKCQKELRHVLIKEFGEDSICDGLELLKKTNIPVLYIGGEKDNVVLYKDSTLVIKNEVSNPNVRVLEVKGRNHQPYWDQKSQDNLKKVIDKSSLNADKSILIDYEKDFCDDKEVFREIINFLD